ncbi:hypothetical protein ABBQ32_008505 [Trebouxia sp. C0010 RCD-2024]
MQAQGIQARDRREGLGFTRNGQASALVASLPGSCILDGTVTVRNINVPCHMRKFDRGTDSQSCYACLLWQRLPTGYASCG